MKNNSKVFILNRIKINNRVIIFPSILFTIILIFINTNIVQAQDFSATSGDRTIYYSIISEEDHTVMTTYKDGDNEYDFNNDYYSVYGVVTIPSSVTYNNQVYSVIRIGEDSFFNCKGLMSITIPNSVKVIDDQAFVRCESLESVTIPNSVIIIGDNAFAECTKLSSITIPNSVIIIGNSAFQNCTNLTSIAIPNSVISIGSKAFSNCDKLTSVKIPNSVIHIGIDAFDEK
jgi:hypothetical protein